VCRVGRRGELKHSSTRALFGPFSGTASRTQVRAEAIEARRLGLLDGHGDRDPVQAAPAQAESMRQAGLRAIGATATLASRQHQ